MGNKTSQYSCYSTEILKSGGKTAMLLDTTGNIRKVQLPVKSAEIMIEQPGLVITPVDELRRRRRIWALPADEELVAGKAYLLVPASRVHSKASDFEMAITEQWDCEKNKNTKRGQNKRKKAKSGNKAKVIPVQSTREEQNELKVFPVQSQRLGKQGRWNPVLEPILESL